MADDRQKVWPALTRYRTIVADPPWALEWHMGIGEGRSGRDGLPYTPIWDAPRVALSWGFRPTYTCCWGKPGLGAGGRFRHTVEFFLFCERGPQLPITRRDLPTHFIWPRGDHSAKPDAFYDLVEEVSPGPRLEMFARRQRLGWDTWGDEALNHIEMEAS